MIENIKELTDYILSDIPNYNINIKDFLTNDIIYTWEIHKIYPIFVKKLIEFYIKEHNRSFHFTDLDNIYFEIIKMYDLKETNYDEISYILDCLKQDEILIEDTNGSYHYFTPNIEKLILREINISFILK